MPESVKKIDVCVIYYGKPYQTILSVLTLLKFSREYINKVYITVEKKQPFYAFGDVYKVIQALAGTIPLKYYYPDSFYNLDTLDVERVKREQDLRWSIPYQYALENSAMRYLFVMHNDMTFQGDMIGKMLPIIQEDTRVAGVGAIGQCWSCPAYTAALCSSAMYAQYVPDQAEAIALHEKHNPPRKAKDIEILQTGRVHPLPECRLNEYACMINLEIYRKTTLPFSENVCFGGNWGFTADLGTGWFYQMVNQGYQFRHFVLEDYAIHSQFNPAGQGIGAYSNKENYFISEANALEYLKQHFATDASLSFRNRILSSLRTVRYLIPEQFTNFKQLVKKNLSRR